MKLTLAQTATFASLWKYWGLNDEDLRALERQVMDQPSAGKVMRNTGGVRKVRFAPASRGSGKSGGFRICYLYFPAHDAVYFLLIFPKNEQPNLTSDQEKACRVLSKAIKQTLDALAGKRGI
ncbi:MAG TPA: type II toxin-antitoxin system RelE/ParE family toxin [Tepidisphaeraceae bacterium]|nr:type II toxin-antitoxin system RelE/ParE family toxin [Tepidisphaeraceae bacterium]